MNKRREIDPDSNLFTHEAETLNKLQQNLAHHLPKISKYDFDKQGYIEEDNHIIELQLQDIDLKSLPKSIEHLSNLRRLNLACNSLQKVDFILLQNFKHLETLNLKQNQLQNADLTPLQNCPQLEILDLSHNKLQKIDLTPLQECFQLRNLILESNQLQTINLTPLKHCPQLHLLDLEQNNLQHIYLDFLHHSKSLWSLDISDNPLTSLDITPLLSLPRLELFTIDDDVSLEAFPVPRDYTNNLHWFISEYLPRVKWIMTKEDAQYESLFAMYQNIVKHFYHDEFWADYRERRLAHPPQSAHASYFFEYAVQRFLSIKDRKLTDHYNEDAEHSDIRTPWRRKIQSQLQDRFLNALDLTSALKAYWETGNESRLTVDLLEGVPLEDTSPEIIILHFWLGGPSNQLLRVSTITWVRILVNDDTHSYQVRLGFNRGYLKKDQKYHPIPPPVEFPSDVFISTEVRYEIKSFTSSNALDIITRGHEWLKEGYYPKFDPDWPEVSYFGDSLQLGF